ncbi:hypothetical protein LEP1GSC173_4162 [Leptospira interrogans str. HAI1594]|nr:hypothetical protein LEP1GSC173_4162 [Leptospira interrogans str. HAI1594]
MTTGYVHEQGSGRFPRSSFYLFTQFIEVNVEVNVEVVQDFDSDRIFFFQKTKQNVLWSDIIATKTLRLILSNLVDDSFSSFCKFQHISAFVF